MASDPVVKILVFGDVEGNFAAFAKRVTSLNKKAGPFECGFCVGNFFGDGLTEEANLAAAVDTSGLPVPVYVLGPNTTDATKYFGGDSPDLAKNVTYLGTRGILNMACGVSVAYLSGTQGSSSGPCQFDAQTVTDLIKAANAGAGFNGVDLFLTSQWPSEVWKYDAGKLPFSPADKGVSTSDQVARAASALRPRYHFAALNDVYYARQPYRNHRVLSESANQVTRFVGLARLANQIAAGDNKARKPVYAFNVTPMARLDRGKLAEQPPDTSEFPYAAVLNDIRRQAQASEDGSGQYFYNMQDTNYDDDDEPSRKKRKGKGRHSNRGGHSRDERGGGEKQPPTPCWFCLSNAEVEKHLVIAIGTFAYLALAKGGLTADHALILPIDHVQSISAASDDLLAEVARFKDALRDCYANQAKKSKNVVFFERNFRTQHFQIQAVPVPAHVTPEKVERMFAEMGEHHGIQLSRLPADTSVSAVVTEGNPYFWVETAPGAVHFSPIGGDSRKFPVQFGREVLACPAILDVAHRADWKDVKLSREDEFEHASALREKFKKYDFTEEEDEDESESEGSEAGEGERE